MFLSGLVFPIPERTVPMSVRANANWIGLLAIVSAVAVRAAEIKAESVIRATSGSFVSGKIFLTDNDGTGLRVKGEIRGLAPGMHGFHVHEYGDCTDTAAASAGGHFNPGNTAHGDPMAVNHHAGDLGNIQADTAGVARIDRVFPGLSLRGENSVAGRSFVVHAKDDDLKSQPAGNSGNRIGCGVIGLSKP
jgi:Cu-Zn family superoxide dismutase